MGMGEIWMAKTVLITGAAQRIGRSLALALAKDGWDVVVHYHRSQFEADTLVQQILHLGQKAVSIPADLKEESQAASLIDRAANALGGLTCLINNASVFIQDTADTISHETWEQNLNINVRAPLILSQCFAQQVGEGDQNIINISDALVDRPRNHFASYTLSKKALNAVTEMMAYHLAPRIRVNAIALGLVLPSVNETYVGFEEQRENSPLQRTTTLAEVADMTRMILACPSMTGALIPLDSGLHLK